MANFGLNFSVDLASAAKMGSAIDDDKTRKARLAAAYRRLIPSDPRSPDPMAQAMLLSDEFLINEQELADRLKVSLSLVQHWRSHDEGPPFYRFGTAQRSPVRYLWPEILVWLRETFWVQPAAPMLPHQMFYKAGHAVLWTYAKPSEPEASTPGD